MRFPRGLLPALAVASLALPLWAQEQVDNPGRVLASNCYQCHGTNGAGVAGGIEGIDGEEIVSELRSFARRNPTGEEGVMVIHARAYTAAEAQLIADYLSTVCTGGSCGGDGETPAPEPVQVALHIDRTRYGDVLSDVAALACTGRCTEIQTELDPDTRVSLTAVPRNGGLFRGWTGACEGRARVCDLDLTEARDVTARFRRQ